MKTLLRKNIASILGGFTGAGVGYLYWIQVQNQADNQAIPIETNPFVCSIWGAIIFSMMVLTLKRETEV